LVAALALASEIGSLNISRILRVANVGRAEQRRAGGVGFDCQKAGAPASNGAIRSRDELPPAGEISWARKPLEKLGTAELPRPTPAKRRPS